MKRAVSLSIILFISVASVITAQEKAIEADQDLTRRIVNFVHLDLLGEQDVFKTEEGIQEMQKYSINITPFYKDILFDRHSYKPLVTIGINLFTGGLGSLIVDKDYLWGSIMQGGMVASYTVLIIGFISPNPEAKNVLYPIGQIGASVFTAMGIAVPIIRMIFTNKKLKRALLMEDAS